MSAAAPVAGFTARQRDAAGAVRPAAARDPRGRPLLDAPGGGARRARVARGRARGGRDRGGAGECARLGGAGRPGEPGRRCWRECRRRCACPAGPSATRNWRGSTPRWWRWWRRDLPAGEGVAARRQACALFQVRLEADSTGAPASAARPGTGAAGDQLLSGRGGPACSVTLPCRKWRAAFAAWQGEKGHAFGSEV